MKKQLLILLAFLITGLYGQQLVQAEYYFDDDPGYGLATSLAMNPAQDLEIQESLDVSNLNPGFHTLYIRVKDESGHWSQTLVRAFYIEENRGETSLITNVEYFYDEDPGFGNGIPYAEFQQNQQLELNFLAGLSNLEAGYHDFYIRTRNTLNQWSQTLSQSFEWVNCDLSISGYILDENETAISSGMLILYQYFGEGSVLGIDTLYLQDGTYTFSQVCPNSFYFIKVIPEDNNSFLPTYYGDTPYWQNASFISTQQSSLSNMNIIVSSFAEMEAGTSQVKGHIFHAESKGEPVKNVDVILELDAADDKSNFLPVAYDKSNELGEWVMPNLPQGNFRIKVEIAGLEMDTTYHIEITSDNTIVEDLNFYVDFNTGIFIEHIGLSELNLESEIQIYPNPSTGTEVWIKYDNSDIRIEELVIYNYAGQQVRLSNTARLEKAIDVGEFAKGLYIFKIKTDKGLMIQKVIIQ